MTNHAVPVRFGSPTRTEGRARAFARLVVLVAVFGGTAAGAQETPDPVPYATMRDFLNSHQSCYVWAVGVMQFGRMKNFTTGEAFCLFDGVTNEGTLSERRGCMVAKFVPETGAYFTEFIGTTIASRKPCSPEIVARFLDAKEVSRDTLQALSVVVGSNKLEIGGEGSAMFAFARAICRNVVNLENKGFDCKRFTEEAEAEAMKAVEVAPKEAEAPKKGEKPNARSKTAGAVKPQTKK